MENTKEYEFALNKARQASSEFRDAQIAYRARLIGDAEFLAARAKWDASQEEFDKAYDVEKNLSPKV